ncbi:MAG: AAA family ATPase [Hormoscilla sp.]
MTNTITTIGGYSNLQLLHDSQRTIVYRGLQNESKQPVVIKLLKSEYPTFNELVNFRMAYVIALNLDLPGVVKPLALENYGNGFVLVMPDFGSISLGDYITKQNLSLGEFLQVAIALGGILDGLYRHRVIHKDIKPANILIHPETLEVQVIDFSISSLLPKETQVLQNPGVLEGTLAYMSPEQTGRMNRGIDYRSDFYSLGVTFYQLLTGQLPFPSDDPMELVHCHIARTPTPPHEVKPDIPQMLSDIVMKLMAKTAEDRYQTARGLQHDLEVCYSEWVEIGSITPFELATRDISDRFSIPEKLYGRAFEVSSLLAAFNRVASGKSEMMLVAGFSGIGKTAVVNEVHKPIVRQRGYFIKGKFDQFQRNIPFYALVQAFSSLMGQLLTESAAQLQQWQDKIMAALGENGQVIIDVIPELERVIGKQPPVPELSGSAAQNRFNLLFGKFIRVFATKEHPLVIFLDDLQWADSASLKLMQLLMSASDSPYILLIGAYRDNEVNRAHPLMLTLDEIGKTGATVNLITLAPLDINDLNRLIADSLICPPSLALPLTELVHHKTEGNPFFSNQFLKSLHLDGLITFDFDSGCWQCDIAKVKELSLTDDVVEFMALQLQKLPSATQNVLKLAACIGNQFDLATCAIVSEQSMAETAASLWKGLQEGLIIPISQTYKFFQSADSGAKESENLSVDYKFLHDRVQQAAYSLIPEVQKQATHYRIGKLLLLNLSESERNEKLFDIVNQINIGQTLLPDEIEIKQLIELNFMAGQKAKAATAYAGAKNYFKVGIGLLAENAWITDYDLAFEFHLNLAETELMSADFELLSQTIFTLLKLAKSSRDRAQVYVIKVNQYALQGSYSEAIQAGLEGLQGLGITVSRDLLKELIQQGLTDLEEKLENRSIISLLDLPTASNPEVKVAIELLMNMLPAAYITSDIDLYSFTIVRNVRLSIEQGNMPESITGYVNYGFLLGLTKNQYQRGVEFADLALQLSYKLNSKSERSSACFLLGGWIYVWAKPIQKAAEINYEGFLAGMESGELQYAGYNLFANIYNRLFQGENLASIAIDLDKYWSIAEKIQNDLALSVLAACRFFINKLSGTVDERDTSPLSAEEQAWIERHQASQSYLPLGIYYILQMHEACLRDNLERGIHDETEASNFLMACAGSTTSTGYYYYSSLNLLGLYFSLSEVERRDALQQIENNQGQLKSWSESCPENFLHKYLLVEADRHRVLGENVAAMELYERAITGAKENGYVQEEALGNELAAKFYLDWGKQTIAQAYMVNAYYGYARWGAKAKVKDLEERYPQLLAPILNQETTRLSPGSTLAQMTMATVTSTSSGTSALLDFSSAIKTSQALSGEINLEQLLSKLMQAVMENAGATKGALLLPEAETLVIEAKADYTEEAASILVGERALEEKELPVSIINTVWRTREPLVLNDVMKSSRFASDSYLIRCHIKSILCLPLLNQGKLIAILYLENHLTTRAFTPERLSLLQLLAGQAAISLENARLYNNLEKAKEQLEAYSQTLEEQVAARTQELKDKNLHLAKTLSELQRTQAQMIQSEKMSSLGQMVAGIAHEINNPVSFIYGNVDHANDYVQDLLHLIETYQVSYPNPTDIVSEATEEIDLEYLVDDLSKLMGSMKSGAQRIGNIVLSLRNFSRLDESSMKPVEIHDGIESTLLIVQHRLESANIHVILAYSQLPQVTCYASELNQVFLHILNNAIDVLLVEMESPQIIITTSVTGSDTVKISIADNGPGMSDEVRSRIFDPFFTTKPVGSGTGLGLAVSYQIVVEKHGGSLTCISALGKGTEFIIEIPMGPKKT